ncbi:MAG: hypothetical protein KBF43_02990 [Dermatophilaceae bacterium]|nr:hypothetical protein [Dermatophilaceae bacterium]
MSIDDAAFDRESIGDDLEVWSVDDETQLQPGDTLIDRGVDDVLDEGFSPPERPRGSLAYGTTAYEMSQHETIEQRILQEEPDPFSAYGAPDDESGERARVRERLGGIDPDGIYADEDFEGQAGRLRSGRLVARDEFGNLRFTTDVYAGDVGIDGGAASAEEAAMHIIDVTEDELA